MEILRMFVNPLENILDLDLVFFTLQDSLPLFTLRHLVEFKHFVDEYPEGPSEPKYLELALGTPGETFYHLP